MYVDDLLIWAADDLTIEDFIVRIRGNKVQLRRENTAKGYLGVDIARKRLHLLNGVLPRISLQLVVSAKTVQNTKFIPACPDSSLSQNKDGPLQPPVL